MYNIGDKVSYPMHGAGLIQAIEEKLIKNEKRSYYIVHIEHGNMSVMVPVLGCDAVGLRPIVGKDDLAVVYDALAGESTVMDDNWNRRNRDNMERLKTGKLEDVAGVIRDLTRVDRVKKLSTGEKKMLSNAKNILASEMSMVLGKTEAEIIDMIDAAI